MNKTAIELIAQEREEQLTKHGRTIEKDVAENNEGQLTDAAATLTVEVPEGLKGVYIKSIEKQPPIGWSQEIWSKMIEKSYKNRLIIAGALIAAEIDRVDYLSKQTSEEILKETLI